MGNRDCYLVDLSRSLIPEGGGRAGSGEENVDLSQIEFLFSVPQRASVCDGKSANVVAVFCLLELITEE